MRVPGEPLLPGEPLPPDELRCEFHGEGGRHRRLVPLSAPSGLPWSFAGGGAGAEIHGKVLVCSGERTVRCGDRPLTERRPMVLVVERLLPPS